MDYRISLVALRPIGKRPKCKKSKISPTKYSDKSESYIVTKEKLCRDKKLCHEKNFFHDYSHGHKIIIGHPKNRISCMKNCFVKLERKMLTLHL